MFYTALTNSHCKNAADQKARLLQFLDMFNVRMMLARWTLSSFIYISPLSQSTLFPFSFSVFPSFSHLNHLRLKFLISFNSEEAVSVFVHLQRHILPPPPMFLIQSSSSDVRSRSEQYSVYWLSRRRVRPHNWSSYSIYRRTQRTACTPRRVRSVVVHKAVQSLWSQRLIFRWTFLLL